MRRLLPIALFLLAGCNDVPWLSRADAAPAVEAIAFDPDATLADGLTRIGAVLDSAIATGLNEVGVQHMLRAEALSDRVLETRMPFGWLASDYRVEARVWQIQAQADRIVARLRAGARTEDLLPDAETLRGDVTALREALTAGGEGVPAPVDRLLQKLDSATIGKS